MVPSGALCRGRERREAKGTVITNVVSRNGSLYCAAHVALVRCIWKEQTYLMHPAYWCEACREFVASDAVPEEMRREASNPMAEPLVHGKEREVLDR